MADNSTAVVDSNEELSEATARAEHAEAELARLRGEIAHHPNEASDQSSQGRPASQQARGWAEQVDAAASADTPERSVVYDKQPPSPSSAGDENRVNGGDEELRKDSMMAHLLDSLEAGKDIGHYGRLVFAMVARHFLPHAEVVKRLTRDRDFSEEDAELMLRQTEGRDYSPPKRARIVEWQAQQEFPILPNVEDPDCGNLYRTLKFPQEVYRHIGHYQEEKMQAGE